MKVQKYSSGTGSPGWSWKKGRKTVVCVCVCTAGDGVASWPGDLVCVECEEENRPFSGQQHQTQFGLNPAVTTTIHLEQHEGDHGDLQ